MAVTCDFNFTEQELKTPIKEVGLSPRAMKILKRTDIETLGDLVGYIQTNKLSKLYGMGETRIQDIMNRLAEIQSPEYHARTQEIAKRQARLVEIDTEIQQLEKTIQKLRDYKLIHRVEIARLTELNRGTYA